MAVAVDISSSAVTADGAQTSLSWSHTCTGSNLILIVGLSFRTLGTLPTNIAVTYNGVAMTNITTVGGGAATVTKGSLWYLANPATGSHTIAVSWTNNNWCVGGGTSFTGAAGTVSGTQTFESGSTTTPSITVTSATGAMVVDVLATAGTSSTAPGAGQTEQYETHGSPNQVSGSGYTASGGASVTMAETMGSADQAVQIGVSVDVLSSGYLEPRSFAYVIT